jgi:hypothetical protein
MMVMPLVRMEDPRMRVERDSGPSHTRRLGDV